MNRTIKEATVKRFHYDNHAQFEQHLADFTAAYNFGRRLKTLRGLTPYEYICKLWTSEPERFRLNSIHQMPGSNIIVNDGMQLGVQPTFCSPNVARNIPFSTRLQAVRWAFR